MLKRVAAIILLFCLVAPFAVTYTMLHVKKKAVKKEVKAGLISRTGRSGLVHLEFSKAGLDTEVRWKHSKEFEYRGEMYDVVERHETADSVSFWCWWDHEETSLNKKLDELVLNSLANNKNNKQTQDHFTSFLKSLFHPEPVSWKPQLTEPEETTTFYTDASVIPIHFSPPVPPPELS